MTTKLLIADDNGMIREGMRMYLALEPGFKIVSEAGDGKHAVQLARELQPDVVLMDLRCPVWTGLRRRALSAKSCPTRKW